MQTVYLDYPLDKKLIEPEKIVLALGFFDGVHLGHQQVIKKAREIAKANNLKLAVMTFDQSPKVIHQKIDPKEVSYLTTIERKLELFEELGVDIVYIVKYSKAFSSQTAEEFVDNYIVALNADTAVAGFDYTYGRGATASMRELPKYSQGRFKVEEVAEYKSNSEKIASRKIHQLLLDGQINDVNHELGYKYQNSGIVVDGNKRGRDLGFPTANLKITETEALPKVGVYITRTKVAGTWYPSMTQIGYNLTFAGQEKTVESYLLDFDQRIYGQKLRIEWNQFLRDEIKFEDVTGLIDQLTKDEKATRTYFGRKE